MITISDIQAKLNARGFHSGTVDGILGRQTIQAIKAFQIQRPPMAVDGIPGPRTLAELFRNDPMQTEKASVLVGIPWLDLAITKKGLSENTNNAELKKFLHSDGGSIGDPALIPWCGDFVETCIALTLVSEILPANPYLARNWMHFGVPCEPQLGAIAVFWRGSKNGTNGHVAFVVGKGNGVLYILGGNQANRVSVMAKSTTQLLGTRWPKTVPMSVIPYLPTLVGGKLSINEA